jgi:hypothetical protein
MNTMARNALTEAQRGALTPFVIEWAGQPVASVKKALASAGKRSSQVANSFATARKNATSFSRALSGQSGAVRWSEETPMRRAKTLSTGALYQRCSLV